MTEKKGLYAKMAQIMGALDRVPKNQESSSLRYKYVSESDIADMIREQLAQHNIAFFPSMIGFTQEKIVSAKGSEGYHTTIDMEYTFVCGDTGETKTVKWHGESDDYGDKGIAKAATLAQKSFLLKTFMMSTGDPQNDPDSQDIERTHVPAPEQQLKDCADARLDDMVRKAHDFWDEPGKKRPVINHVINRISNALGLKGTPGGKKEALFDMIRAQYTGTVTEAWKAIQLYEPLTHPQPENGQEPATQAELPIPDRLLGQPCDQCSEITIKPTMTEDGRALCVQCAALQKKAS